MARDLEIGQPSNSEKCSEAADGVARESEGRSRVIASTRCTTRSAAKTSWPMPGPSAAPTRARRAWTVRTSRISKRTACSGGSANWRLRSGRRRTDRTRSDECSSRRPIRQDSQAAGHLDPAGSGLHDSSDAGARTDLRSRPSARAVRLPAGPQCPAGGDRGGRDRCSAAIRKSWTPTSRTTSGAFRTPN